MIHGTLVEQHQQLAVMPVHVCPYHVHSNISTYLAVLRVLLLYAPVCFICKSSVPNMDLIRRPQKCQVLQKPTLNGEHATNRPPHDIRTALAKHSPNTRQPTPPINTHVYKRFFLLRTTAKRLHAPQETQEKASLLLALLAAKQKRTRFTVNQRPRSGGPTCRIRHRTLPIMGSVNYPLNQTLSARHARATHHTDRAQTSTVPAIFLSVHPLKVLANGVQTKRYVRKHTKKIDTNAYTYAGTCSYVPAHDGTRRYKTAHNSV